MMLRINVCRPAVNMCRLEIRMFLAIRDSGGLNSIYWEQQGQKSLQFEVSHFF